MFFLLDLLLPVFLEVMLNAFRNYGSSKNPFKSVRWDYQAPQKTPWSTRLMPLTGQKAARSAYQSYKQVRQKKLRTRQAKIRKLLKV